MSGRPLAAAVRGRVAALVAALVAGAAMVVASPVAPAHAADVETPAPVTTQTLRFTAQARTSGGISVQEALPSFTCYIDPSNPYVHYVTSPSTAYIGAQTDVNCRYDYNQQPVVMPRLIITAYLVENFTAVDFTDTQFPGVSSARVILRSFPCRHADWQNQARLTAYAPAGYSPPALTSPFYFSESSIAHCPADPPDCAITCPGPDGGVGLASGALPAVREA